MNNGFWWWASPTLMRAVRAAASFRQRLRDWRRGYSDADIESAREKAGRMVRFGEAIGLTDGEMKAIQHGALRQTKDACGASAGFRPVKAGCDSSSVAEV